MNKFQVLICKMYLILYEFHIDYKPFLMNKEGLIATRMVFLFFMKLFLMLTLLHSIGFNISFLQSDWIFVILFVYSLLVLRLSKYCNKNMRQVRLDLTRKKIKLIYYFWHLSLFLVNIIFASITYG